jgi:hypothetical protein
MYDKKVGPGNDFFLPGGYLPLGNHYCLFEGLKLPAVAFEGQDMVI